MSSTQRRHRYKTIAAVITGLCLVLVVALFSPIVTFRPVCIDEEGTLLFRSLPGGMSTEFTAAMDDQGTGGRSWVRFGQSRLIRPIDWLDREWYWNIITKSVYALVKARSGADRSDVEDGRVHIAGFSRLGFPSCGAVRALAVVGGSWEHEGPPVRYLEDIP